MSVVTVGYSSGGLAPKNAISFEPGFGAYEDLAQKIRVPFSRIFSFFLCSFEGSRAISKPAPNPSVHQTPVETLSESQKLNQCLNCFAVIESHFNPPKTWGDYLWPEVTCLGPISLTPRSPKSLRVSLCSRLPREIKHMNFWDEGVQVFCVCFELGEPCL